MLASEVHVTRLAFQESSGHNYQRRRSMSSWPLFLASALDRVACLKIFHLALLDFGFREGLGPGCLRMRSISSH